MAAAMDEGGMTERRQSLLAGLTGEVVEVGAGHGVNFAHYPAEVTQVGAVEPEPRLRARAQASGAEAAVAVEVVPGVAERLPVADHSVGAVVFCMVLCSLPDVGAALAEARRVLKPGGRSVFWSMCAPTRAAWPGCRMCWMPPSGRSWSAAAISAVTPRPRSGGPGSTSIAWIASCSRPRAPRSPSTSSVRPYVVAMSERRGRVNVAGVTKAFGDGQGGRSLSFTVELANMQKSKIGTGKREERHEHHTNRTDCGRLR
ncbi:class I SAM-dependent methyltransferase [Nonomuraea sp. NPDC049480]|uniref:class I SAM-dependent methyltransferase n=1 Tax=Nonomuraea sp. NPDC049480 TaxID=3364353 RepID=UPI0037AEE5D2